MNIILTIAKWEVLRLRSRFGGKSRIVIFPVLLLALVLSLTIYHQDFSPGKGIYTIGIESGSLIVQDSRFNTITLNAIEGKEQLRTGSIDLYLYDNKVLMRNDDRSQYAAGALKKYLENLELNRIAGQYAVSQAFPLRIKISYLNSPDASAGKAAEISPFTSPEPQVVESVPQSPDQNCIDGYFESTTADSPSTSGYPMPEVQPEQPSANDLIISSQLGKWQSGGKLPEFKAQFTSENEVIIPSLMMPPMPLAQVILAFLYVIPMFFISVFFTSSFTEEKVNRKLVILLSSPVTRLQVILGKMLPYYVYSLLVITGVTIFLKGNVLLALAIFFPVMLFVFSVYLMVALTYRTFKDQTFFSVLALSVITVYLVVPAMFAGVSSLSYVSPLTLAVQMFRGEPFTISQYLIATIPLYLIFFLAMYIGRRVFNEEFLMGFKPLRVKVMEAVYLGIDRQHLNLSVFILSLLLIPVVFAAQLVSIVIVSNLPAAVVLWIVMLVSIVIEEIAKSMGIYALLKYRSISGHKMILILSALSALGFWAGEKILLMLAANMASETTLVSVFLGSGLNGGWLFILPLILHFVTTFLVCTIASHGHKRGYFLGIVCGTAVHAGYNFIILFITGAFR